MKNNILFILLLISTITIAQDFNIVKSDVFKDKYKKNELSFSLGDEQGGIITIRKYFGGIGNIIPKGYYIQHFDKDLILKNTYDYKMDYSSNPKEIQSIFLKNGEFHLVETTLSNIGGKLTISYNVVIFNTTNFSFSTERLLSIPLDEVRSQRGFSIFPFNMNNSNYDNNTIGKFTFSKNKNFFSINFDIKNKNQDTQKLFVFNSSLEKIYEKTIIKDLKDKFYKFNDIEIDDENGTAYFLAKVYENNSTKEKINRTTNYYFELTKVNKKEEKSTTFKSDNNFINSLYIIKNDGNLIALGFYGEKNDEKHIGVCSFNLDSNELKVKNKIFNPFSENFLIEKYGVKKGKRVSKNKKGLQNIQLKSIEIINNGDLILNAEEIYISSGPNNSSIIHYNDIISIKIDENGKLKWAKNISKNQTGNLLSSYTSISNNGNSYFFLNFSDKTKTLKNNTIKFKSPSKKNSNLFVIVLKHDGTISYKRLISRKDTDLLYQVNKGAISEKTNEVIFLGNKKKKSQIIKVKI